MPLFGRCSIPAHFTSYLWVHLHSYSVISRKKWVILKCEERYRGHIRSYKFSQILRHVRGTEAYQLFAQRGWVSFCYWLVGQWKNNLAALFEFLERADGGTISVKGELLFDTNDPRTSREQDIRAKRLHFGLVFQSFNLFPQYTALENVILAKRLLAKNTPDFKLRKKEILEQIPRRRASGCLIRVGLLPKIDLYPAPAVGRPTAASCDCPRISAEPGYIMLWRTDVGAWPWTDWWGAKGNSLFSRSEYNYGHCDARDAVCAGGFRQGSIYGWWLCRWIWNPIRGFWPSAKPKN